MRDRRRGAPGLADELLPAGPCASSLPRPAGVGRERPPAARGLGDQRGAPLVRQGAGRVLASLRAAGARSGPRSPRLRGVRRRDRAQRRDRQPARARGGLARGLERELPRRAGRVRARRSRHRRLRARVDLRAAHGAHGQPEPLRRPARVPHDAGWPEFRLHDPPVRGRVARQREQGARASGERRLDPDERRAGGSRVDGQRRRPEGVAGARERRERARHRAARGRAGGRVPRAARARSGRRRGQAARSESCRRASSTTARSPPRSRAVATAIRDGSLVAAVEAVVGELA